MVLKMLPLGRQLRFHPTVVKDKTFKIWPQTKPVVFMMINLLFHSMPTVQFQEMLFPKTAREKEIRVSVGENTTVLLTKIRFLFFFGFS